MPRSAAPRSDSLRSDNLPLLRTGTNQSVLAGPAGAVLNASFGCASLGLAALGQSVLARPAGALRRQADELSARVTIAHLLRPGEYRARMSYPTGGSYSTPYSPSPLGAPGSPQAIGIAPVTPPGNGAAATSGLFALAAAGCAGVSYAMAPERYATDAQKTSILIAIIAAALGGVLALARMRIGVAIAIGAVTAFIAES